VDKWNVGILIFDNVEVLDFAGPFEVFSRTRLQPGPEARRSDDDSAPFPRLHRGQVDGAGGDDRRAALLPHFGFADAPPIDLLVVPGGFGTRALIHDEDTLAWIRRVAASARKVTSVCTGSLLFARAGLLEGRRATTHWGAHDLLPVVERSHQGRARPACSWTTASSPRPASRRGWTWRSTSSRRCSGETSPDETAHYIEFRRAAGVRTRADVSAAGA